MKPVLWQWGPLAVYSYGFFVALAFVIGHAFATREAHRVGIDPRRISTLCFIILLSGVAGGRLFYVAQHFEHFRYHPWEAFRLDQGGLVWYGAFFLAFAAAIPYIRLKKMSVIAVADLCMPFVALGQALGRVGCFLNGCCYGIPAREPWGIQFTQSHISRLPVQLFNAFLLAVLFGFLFRVLRRGHWPGQVICLYGLLYGAMRFFVEFLRGDQDRLWALTLPQWFSLALFAAACALWHRWHPRRAG